MISVFTTIALPGAHGTNNCVNIVVHIRNCSPIPAQLPFFCMTDLRMNVSAAQGWQTDNISSDGRRLVRFLPVGSNSLDEGQAVPACILTANWTDNGELFVSFSNGNWHALHELRNMKLFCISGAANFPSQRSYLLVEADAVRAAVQAAAGTRPRPAAAPLLANTG